MAQFGSDKLQLNALSPYVLLVLHCGVPTVAVVLEVHVLVATSKNIIYVACYSH